MINYTFTMTIIRGSLISIFEVIIFFLNVISSFWFSKMDVSIAFAGSQGKLLRLPKNYHTLLKTSSRSVRIS